MFYLSVNGVMCNGFYCVKLWLGPIYIYVCINTLMYCLLVYAMKAALQESCVFICVTVQYLKKAFAH